LAATAWIAFAPWWLVRYPTDLDQTLHYTGTVAIPVTPGASSEVRHPVSITRHVRVVGSTFDRVRLRETVTTRIGTDVQVQENGYVLDRRTMKPLRGAGNYAFTTGHRVERTGAYTQTQFPMHVQSTGAYKIWSDDTASTYNALASGDTTKVGKLELVVLRANAAAHPVTNAYRASLGLPETTTLQEAARLAHVDLDAVMTTLSGVLPDTAIGQLTAKLREPMPLMYQLESSGTVGVEPLTGGVVQVQNVVNRLTVAPDLDALQLRAALADFALDPTVRTVLAKLDDLAARPPVAAMSLSYSQTPASVRAAAHTAADMRNQSRLVSMWVPTWASALALVLIGGALVWPKRHEEAQAVAATATHHWRQRAA
jgi:hypothetical protein